MNLPDTFDRLNLLSDCLETVQNLLCPCDNLTVIDRDKFAALLGLLLDEQNIALRTIQQAFETTR